MGNQCREDKMTQIWFVQIEVNVGPGSGVKVLNRPAPAPFQSVRYAEQT
jgi:ATP-dependent Lon protease